ncbi:serine hydrolase domain-containing protein [Paenibacillus bouchesdurhonensis]|uniref:serine hydrolase domain-containing protein n=1 Tax=Paenibacillus bouchesdurhonensis TaxID=1870990 RepID=UPI000DA63D76|nr:serine hydrolase [Paenibacillus bouchesdurhonensis]
MQPISSILASSDNSYTSSSSRRPLAQSEEGLKLLRAADEEIIQQFPKMHSFAVVRQGQLLIERYYNEFNMTDLHDLRSATKSILSILFGIASYRGELPPLHEPILDTVRKYAVRNPGPLWEQLTLRHLLTMTSGFYWKTGAKMGEALIHRFHQSPSWTKYILHLPIEEHKIGTFQYCSVDSHLLSILLTEWTGLSAADYARQYLFDPLGIEESVWNASPEGHSTGHIGLHLTTRDMTKIGQLCLQGGAWEGEQILSADWLRESMAPLSAESPGYGRYGCHWWTTKTHGISYAYAHGHGGQQINVIPALDSVVIFTAASDINRWKNPRPLLEKFIIPALKNS